MSAAAAEHSIGNHGDGASITSLSIYACVDAYDRFRFYLDKHFRMNETPHFDHARGWTNGTEKFTMCPSCLLPVADICDEDARSNDVRKRCAGFFEGGPNVF